MTDSDSSGGARLLTPGDVRRLAERTGIRPTKTLGQNFVVDAGTVRRIVRTAEVGADDVVLEVGPGLGSLTLALLPRVRAVTAVEIDPRLADALPATVAEFAPDRADRLRVVAADAMRVTEVPGPRPTALVANLPYNVAVPVLLNLLESLPSLRRGLVMVQAEVADRLAAGPGGRTYGAPSAKAAWYAEVRRAGSVGRSVFWPVPNVDSGLVALRRRNGPPDAGGAHGSHAPAGPGGAAPERGAVFAVVDAAFAQRRKTLRAALAGWAGSAPAAERVLRAAGIDPGARGESLGIADFARIAAHADRAADTEGSGGAA
ncbi:16S rRNA (adenine(1518)-N(6)/adenine(1519)-N(6))-dimethyltransferase RsmA [Streptomonospora litoralis]|uniref:16S rRNA (adenine(1518)-N(6)/adenine(1519)-N(6))- dimethyltransferase RsmA n=1 Tax=Streptomonospora litoralis TaxID=2498135 RepID=UPI00103561DC|nr:16S rRNA (adenine(1518)-N(6)/adenine(1519)-N(6))-dimethyltransferase RsmA [Streptomonospora litoralis]